MNNPDLTSRLTLSYSIIQAIGFLGPAAKTVAAVLSHINGKKYVRIVNTMGHDVIVTANCASKDDRIGEYILKDGESFAWTFKPHFFGRTLFWCHISTNIGYDYMIFELQ